MRTITKDEVRAAFLYMVGYLTKNSTVRSSATTREITADISDEEIREIYVQDCNRILGIERFTHDDAFSVQKLLEMFNIIQNHYNPERDIDRAIELHNPTASVAYREKVLWNFRKLVKQSEIINQL